MSDQFEVWTAVAQLLRAQLTESVWFSTFAEVVPQVDEARLLDWSIQVPSTLARDRILTRYLPLITDALAELGEGESPLRRDHRPRPSMSPARGHADRHDMTAPGGRRSTQRRRRHPSRPTHWTSPG